MSLSIERELQRHQKLPGNYVWLARIAFAQSYDQQSGEYDGVSRWAANIGANVARGLLVWRSALPQQDTPTAPGTTGTTPGGNGPKSGDDEPFRPGDAGSKKPHRFFGSISLDPDKAGLQVAKIAEEILFELGRPNGASLRLTLEVEASAPAGYPDDIVEVVRANIRDLKLDTAKIGFEEE